jgi:hypothetical protein
MALAEELFEVVRSRRNWRNAKDVCKDIAAFIEAREEAERERVKAVIKEFWKTECAAFSQINRIYPPKVEMLPAGMYVIKMPSGEVSVGKWEDEFAAYRGWEYRPIKNPFKE